MEKEARAIAGKTGKAVKTKKPSGRPGSGGREVELTNPDKVLFPDEKITKGEFVSYYGKIAGTMLPHLKGRLISMQRFPEGIVEGHFFQKQAPEYFPQWVNRVRVDLRHEGRKTYITCDNRQTLVYLANLVSIPHVWLSRVDKLNYPDRLIFDLDPPEGSDDFGPVKYAALIFKEVLETLSVRPFLMLTGSRGLHVVVPLDRSADFRQASDFAREAADVLIGMAPELFTMELGKTKRGKRIFIDIFRNAFAQTAVAPYSVRARAGAPVAAPAQWSEISGKSGIDSTSFNIRNIGKRLARKGDIWKNIGSRPYSIAKMTEALKKKFGR